MASSDTVAMPERGTTKTNAPNDALGWRELVLATQAGLPLDPRPYHKLAERLGVSPKTVMETLTEMVAHGAIRRIAAVPNHYALRYVANGMSVWDVDDAKIAELGPRIGALPFVSHCYRRPRRLPLWRYNLFAMVHARDRREVDTKVAQIAALLSPHAQAHDVLFSTRILKKTGLRLTRANEPPVRPAAIARARS